MYLSKLEILGFKSFANKTIVNFTKGITGIVGPNGCGKTNIVDAIRWSLGEQKSSTLRSDKMENVIFNGTRQKKPMGMAEVSLTLVNDKGVLPTEFSEVTITRRIFRSGESEYLLNGNLCRLKDITSMFMDTGMGSNAYSVIELKMVETILSNKAEDRRHMFEEAAGVNKYKLRRRLSLKKLDEVKADLNRVNDIVAEVDKKVRSLERQAKKADKYNQYTTLLKEKEMDLADREFYLFSNDRAELSVSKQNLSERKITIDDDIREIENELIIYRDQTAEVEIELSGKRKELHTQNEKLHNVQRNISVAEERRKSLEKNLVRFRQELEELHIQSDETEESIIENQDIILEVESEIELKAKEIEGSQEVIDAKQLSVENKKSELKTQSDSIIEKFKDINNKENELKALKKNLEKNNRIIESANEKIQNITTKIAKSVGFLEELESEQSELVNKLNQSEELLIQKQKDKDNLEDELNSLRKKELEEKGVMMQLSNKIEFLQSLIDNLEGVQKGSKILIENPEWSDAEKSLFADVGSSDEEYRFAIEASLKFVLNNLLIENIEDLNKAIGYLNKKDLGKASFYLLKKDSEKKSLIDKFLQFRKNKKIKKLEIETTFINWANNLVKASEKWQPYFSEVLNSTAVVENLDSAFALSVKYPDFNFATLKGDLVLSSGIIEAGSEPKPEETLFGRKQILDDLSKDLPKIESNLEKLQDLITEKENSLAEIDLKSINDEIKIFNTDLNNIEKQISQIKFEKEKAEEEVEITRNDLEILVSETINLDEEAASLSKNLDEQKRNKEIEEAKLKNLEIELKEFESDFSSTVQNENRKKLELEKLKGQLNNTKDAIVRAQRTKETIKHTIDKREKEIDSTKEEAASIDIIVEDNQIEYDEIYEVRQKLAEEENEIAARLKSIKDEASTFEKQLQTYRKERETISDKIHEIDLNINKISMKLENLVQHIQEEYNVELEIKEFEEDEIETFNFEERRREVTDLKVKLKNLGPINLLAYSEYEEENERLEFLNQQRNDLIESEKDLVNTIHEINQTAQNLFIETFELIRTNFVKIFRTLFNPGDEADLKLQEDVDPLEAKIEIIAKPKGKRPTSIELLSGGEKTLTATALLFAIYLVKPSPFCILDEVDAPLDDANVDRYTKLISEFSKNTQFIMVTHNKRTMEAAENMYGVTMQQEGISKLVGVQFNEEISASA